MRARIVLLGASNVTRGISGLVGTAHRAVGGPADFLIAMGHGRSYGARSRVLGRSLPGITECGLWNALDDERRPTYGLVTDVGNDVAYGSSVETIAGWVATCVDRLLQRDASLAMTLLPVSSLERLASWQFQLARTLLFPTRHLTMNAALVAARELNERLRDLAETRGIALVEPDPGWYGLDPIHVKRSRLGDAWARAIAAWTGGRPPSPVPASPARWLRIRRLTPQTWWLLGRRRGRPQPAGSLPDGTSIALY